MGVGREDKRGGVGGPKRPRGGPRGHSGVADVWEGTATDLAALAEIDSISANVLSKYLNEHSDYLTSQGIAFSRKTTHGARLIHLEKTGVGNGGDDGND